MKPKTLFTLSVFILFCLTTFGQNRNGLRDSNYIDSLNREHRKLYKQFPDAGLSLINEVMNLSKQSSYPKGIALAHTGFGHSMKFAGKIDSSFFHYHQAANLYLEMDDKRSATIVYYNIAKLYKDISSYDSAFKYFLEGDKIVEGLERKQETAYIKNGLGNLYFELREFDKAIDAQNQALNIWKKLESLTGQANVHNNLANVFSVLQKWEKANYHYKSAKGIYSLKNDISGIAMVQSNQGNLLFEQGKYSEALQTYDSSLIAYELIDDTASMANIYLNIGATLFESRDFPKAKQVLKKGLACLTGRNLVQLEADTYVKLSLVDSALNLMDSAKIHLQHARKLIYKSEMESLLFARKSELEKIERDNAMLQIRDLQNRADYNQKLWLGSLFAGSIILLILVIYFYTRFQSYQKTIRLHKNEFLLQEERYQKSQLQELDKLKSRFFANISHEFRTPLTLILGPAENIWNTTNAPAVKQQVDLIRRNARRVLRLVNQLLDLAKIESGKMELASKKGDLVSFVKRITSTFKELAASKHIDLSFRAEANILPTNFDSDKIEKILVNLLSNAFKFTPENGKIELSLTKDSPSSLCLDVKDNGIGISAEHLPHIFERFYQAKSDDYSTTQPSTGIGLALSKELAELHGGSLGVHSRAGEETVFQLRIPYDPGSPTQSQDHFSKFSTSEGEYAFSKDASESFPDSSLPILLLIEDNADIRLYVRTCLEDQYQLLEAKNGIEGLEIAKKQIPDLIITDVMMPLKDGFALTREIKQNETTDHIPIIILTGKSSQESKLEGLGTDADDYLTKPFDAEELKLRIKNLLNNRKRLQERFSKQVLWGRASDSDPILQEEDFLQKAIQLIETQLGNEDLSIEEFAEQLHLSRTQLFRKLKALTDQSPSRFIRSVRLRHAKELIQSGRLTIAEISYAVGFGSPTYFNRCFKEEFGKVPGAFRAED